MLNQKTFAPLPAVCMVALLAIFVVGLGYMPDVAQAASISKIQGVAVVPGQNSGCSCGPNCQPNARNWGHWPTVWRQWPQRRPDINFPEAVGLERLPLPEGVKPEALPKEESQYSPTAPQPGGDFLPPVGDGPATGPGGPGAPFQLEPGFDPGSGFDQGMPGIENLPPQPAVPQAMPNEGGDNPGDGTPALTPPAAEIPPATDTPPAPSVPAPDKGSADSIPDSSVLTFRVRPAMDSKETVKKENPDVSRDVPNKTQPENSRPVEIQPADPQPSGPRQPETQESGPQLVITQQVQEDLLPAETIAAGAEKARFSSDDAAAGESDAMTHKPAPEPVRQTAFESPAEPWAVPKSWKSQRVHADNSSAVTAELQQPQLRQPAPEPGDMGDTKIAEAPQPAGLKKDRGRVKLVGLEGYCPVDLVRGERWTLGDSRFAVEFEGRTYLMCGPEQHRAFRSNPGRYAPVNRGNDLVLSFEENILRTGRTESCAVFEGRLYMFDSVDTLARFQANPKRYTRALRKARY